MKVAIYDLETSAFDAQGGVILCCTIKEYGTGKKLKTFRGDDYPTWKRTRSNDKPITIDILNYLNGYDILVAHNGEWFDKGFLNSKAIEYNLSPVVRQKKSIDPMQIAKRYMRLGRNALGILINYLDIPHQKSPVSLTVWRRASHDGDKTSMDYIVHHCEQDVKALEGVYDRLRPLIDKVDKQGSRF